jgi:queuine tRNA-ribosyltransferase
MPVGTLGTVKGLTVPMIRQTGSQIILGNTYHLMLRPGEDVVGQLGGLHAFSGWEGPILTDSGGFQIFSLADAAQVDDQSVTFRSHIDGRQVSLSPEQAMAVQETLASDIAMVLDHVPRLPCAEAVIEETTRRTVAWAERCRRAAARTDQIVLGIVQGGLSPRWRDWCTEQLVGMDFAGYAIGGLSVGESPDEMYEVVAHVCPALPIDQPRYLMGVGRPVDLLQSIARGVDMFDCVMPTRNGRNGMAFTDDGPLRLRNSVHQYDASPLQADLETPYSHHSRAYLRHLFLAGEMLGPILLSFHNIAYYQRLMREARQAILADSFLELLAARLSRWQTAERAAGS